MRSRSRITSPQRTLAETLELDAGYLSRLLRNFEKRGLISRKTSAKDGRQSHLALTRAAANCSLRWNSVRSNRPAPCSNALDAAQQDQIVAAMHAIETLLAGVTETKPGTKPRYILREPRTGDFGWIVSRHAELYFKEYGWTEPFEGLCAQIVADFVNNFDPQSWNAAGSQRSTEKMSAASCW